MKTLKVAARPSALTTEAGGAAEPSGAWARKLAEAEVVYVLTAEADGMGYLPGVFGLDILLDTVVDPTRGCTGCGCCNRRECSGRNRAVSTAVMISAIGLLVHDQRTGNIDDEVGGPSGVPATLEEPEMIGNRHQPYPRRLESGRNLGCPVVTPGCRVRGQAVARILYGSAVGCSVRGQRTSGEASSKAEG